MFGLAKKSTVESKNNEIEELEAEIEVLENERNRLQTRKAKEKNRRRTAEKHEKKLREDRDALVETVEFFAEEVYGDVTEKLEDKEEVVETLDEPKVAWKATLNAIVELVIPAGETVVHPQYATFTSKHKKRCSKAFVKDFHVPETDMGSPDFRDSAKRDGDFKYRVGTFVEPEESLDTSTYSNCKSGIHMFTSKSEAEEWY